MRGITYLEGQFHEERLVGGTDCELFVEVCVWTSKGCANIHTGGVRDMDRWKERWIDR